MDNILLIFVILVFVAAFLLVERVLALIIGPQRAETRRFQERLRFVTQTAEMGTAATLLRQTEVDKNTGFKHWLSSWPGVDILNRRLRGSGYKLTATQVVLLSLLMGTAGVAVFLFLGNLLLSVVVGGLLTAALPLKITVDYNKRLRAFEEGLVEALGVMTRSLKAGQPFNESMLMVARELQGPVAEEFGLTFAELNYGLSLKEAFTHMTERVPSVTLKALVVAVLLQRDTGGNLAELLDKISGVLRGRFRFERRVRTLSAEGRLSSVILISVPFVLFGMIYLSSPNYVAELIDESVGHTLIAVAAVFMVVGIIWVRKITRIEV
jgi:tight adherence protein B